MAAIILEQNQRARVRALTEITPLRKNSTARAPFSLWLWSELNSFDQTLPDFGVQKYLRPMRPTPSGISLLMASPDFVHLHAEEDIVFPPDFGSYMNLSHERPKFEGAPWTRRNLEALVAELQRHEIKVYFCVFPLCLGSRFHPEWVDAHSELKVTPRHREEYNPMHPPVIHPIKRLSDGSYYEDFFVEKALQVVAHYGFNGVHLADGYNHPFHSLYELDFSDEMIDQFSSAGDGRISIPFEPQCDGNDVAIEERAEWIWMNRRKEWIEFNSRRWNEFHGKLSTALASEGKEILFNTTWTRDPFEAIYRYGIDYEKVKRTGVTGFVFEAVAGGLSIVPRKDPSYTERFYPVVQASILLTKIRLPQEGIVMMNSVQDITEQWSAIRHAPMFLEREIHSYANLFYYDTQGVVRRCFEGALPCLSSDITENEWNWLGKKWNDAFELGEFKPLGPTLVYSDHAFRAECVDYPKTRNPGAHKLLYELIDAGAPLSAIAEASNLDALTGPILIFNPQHFSTTEIEALTRYKGTVYCLGPMVELASLGNFSASDAGQSFPMAMGVLNANYRRPAGEVDEASHSSLINSALKEPNWFTTELFYNPVSRDFYELCARILSDVEEGPKLGTIHSRDVKLRVLFGPEKTRLLVGNEGYRYAHAEIIFPTPITGLKYITDFQSASPVFPTSKLKITVPPRGIAVIDAYPGGQ